MKWVNAQAGADPETAKKDFSDGLAKIILDTIKGADITGVVCAVTGMAGQIPVTGTATQTTPVHPV